MTREELVNQFCEYRGKCTTDDVVALNFAYDVLTSHAKNEFIERACEVLQEKIFVSNDIVYLFKNAMLDG